MEDDMVMRVARGLYAGEPGRLRAVPSWEEAVRRFPEMPARYRAMARAAIAAMREPTDAMIEPVLKPGMIDQDPRDYWPIMIDAALK